MFQNFDTLPASFFFIIGVFGLLGLILGILYLLALQNTLKAVSPQNRTMRPGQVWLLLIPLFGIVWMFFVVKAMSTSLEAEYRMRGMQTEPQPTYNLGLALAILSVCGIIPVIGSFVSIATIICWIIYWTKINGHKKRLEQAPPFDQGSSQIF